jgi:hypothetical protein
MQRAAVGYTGDDLTLTGGSGCGCTPGPGDLDNKQIHTLLYLEVPNPRFLIDHMQIT